MKLIILKHKSIIYSKLLFTTLLFIVVFTPNLYSCDKSTVSLVSETDNFNGTYTYVINSCTEFLGMEAKAYSFSFSFSGGTFTSVVSATPPHVTTTTSDKFSMSKTLTVVTYTNGSLYSSNGTNLFCNNFTIITNGRAGTILVDTNEDASPIYANCFHVQTQLFHLNLPIHKLCVKM